MDSGATTAMAMPPPPPRPLSVYLTNPTVDVSPIHSVRSDHDITSEDGTSERDLNWASLDERIAALRGYLTMQRPHGINEYSTFLGLPPHYPGPHSRGTPLTRVHKSSTVGSSTGGSSTGPSSTTNRNNSSTGVTQGGSSGSSSVLLNGLHVGRSATSIIPSRRVQIGQPPRTNGSTFGNPEHPSDGSRLPSTQPNSIAPLHNTVVENFRGSYTFEVPQMSGYTSRSEPIREMKPISLGINLGDVKAEGRQPLAQSWKLESKSREREFGTRPKNDGKEIILRNGVLVDWKEISKMFISPLLPLDPLTTSEEFVDITRASSDDIARKKYLASRAAQVKTNLSALKSASASLKQDTIQTLRSPLKLSPIAFPPASTLKGVGKSSPTSKLSNNHANGKSLLVKWVVDKTEDLEISPSSDDGEQPSKCDGVMIKEKQSILVTPATMREMENNAKDEDEWKGGKGEKGGVEIEKVKIEEKGSKDATERKGSKEKETINNMEAKKNVKDVKERRRKLMGKFNLEEKSASCDFRPDRVQSPMSSKHDKERPETIQVPAQTSLSRPRSPETFSLNSDGEGTGHRKCPDDADRHWEKERTRNWGRDRDQDMDGKYKGRDKEKDREERERDKGRGGDNENEKDTDKDRKDYDFDAERRCWRSSSRETDRDRDTGSDRDHKRNRDKDKDDRETTVMDVERRVRKEKDHGRKSVKENEKERRKEKDVIRKRGTSTPGSPHKRSPGSVERDPKDERSSKKMSPNRVPPLKRSLGEVDRDAKEERSAKRERCRSPSREEDSHWRDSIREKEKEIDMDRERERDREKEGEREKEKEKERDKYRDKKDNDRDYDRDHSEETSSRRRSPSQSPMCSLDHLDWDESRRGSKSPNYRGDYEMSKSPGRRVDTDRSRSSTRHVKERSRSPMRQLTDHVRDRDKGDPGGLTPFSRDGVPAGKSKMLNNPDEQKGIVTLMDKQSVMDREGFGSLDSTISKTKASTAGQKNRNVTKEPDRLEKDQYQKVFISSSGTSIESLPLLPPPGKKTISLRVYKQRTIKTSESPVDTSGDYKESPGVSGIETSKFVSESRGMAQTSVPQSSTRHSATNAGSFPKDTTSSQSESASTHRSVSSAGSNSGSGSGAISARMQIFFKLGSEHKNIANHLQTVGGNDMESKLVVQLHYLATAIFWLKGFGLQEERDMGTFLKNVSGFRAIFTLLEETLVKLSEFKLASYVYRADAFVCQRACTFRNLTWKKIFLDKEREKDEKLMELGFKAIDIMNHNFTDTAAAMKRWKDAEALVKDATEWFHLCSPMTEVAEYGERMVQNFVAERNIQFAFIRPDVAGGEGDGDEGSSKPKWNVSTPTASQR